SPTAHAFLAEVAVTASSSLLPALLAACFQLRPFQRRIRLRLDRLPLVSPTAQAFVRPVAVTPFRTLFPDPGLGLGNRAHRLPFQCRISVLSLPGVLAKTPTAQTFLADTTCTALSSLNWRPGLGVA